VVRIRAIDHIIEEVAEMSSRSAALWRSVTLLTAVALACFGPLAAAAAAQGSWYGEYFSNPDLSGKPAIARYESALSFDWGTGSPGPGIPTRGFSARWTRDEWFDAGTYRFSYSSDDGVRIWVGDALVVDDWRERQAGWSSVDSYIGGGTKRVRVEYYEHTGDASLQASWERLGDGEGWHGEYFANRNLSGPAALVREDAAVDFDWWWGSPDPALPVDDFSAVWTRYAYFEPGYYRFNVQSDDGVRVWLDGAVVMDYWWEQDGQSHFADGIYLSGNHALRVEYFEHTVTARIKFWVERSGDTREPWPVDPAPGAAPGLTGPWHGEYFNNQYLNGAPALVRSDPTIDFDWGWGSPAVEVNRNYFSARWTGTFQFGSGRYDFTATSDDGIRLYIDDQLVINAWRPMRGKRYGTATLTEGSHSVRVEYFERSQAAMVRLDWELTEAAPPALAPVPVTPWQPVRLCSGGPLRINAQAIDKERRSGGWVATIWVVADGADCLYTYYWEREPKGGPMFGPITFELFSPTMNAMVGEAMVMSAGEIASYRLYVEPPEK
jgi:hypothetical protein